MFDGGGAVSPDPAVATALRRAAGWLEDAGFRIEPATPPHFDEAVRLWRTLVHDDLRRGARAAIERHGDDALRRNVGFMFAGMGEQDRDGYLDSLARRLTIQRSWSLFFDRYPLLLLPVSLRRPFPVDEDTMTAERVEAVVAAQGPLTSTAMLGLPGLSVPTGLDEGIPIGVQLVAARYREDLCLLGGEAIERGAGRLTPLRTPKRA